MKLQVWGGPMDGREVELPRPQPIMTLAEQPIAYIGDSAPNRIDLVPTMTYEPRQLTAPIARRTDEPECWWVLVPAGSTDAELDRLLREHTTPMVNGRAEPPMPPAPEPPASSAPDYDDLLVDIDSILDDPFWESGPDAMHGSPPR